MVKNTCLRKIFLVLNVALAGIVLVSGCKQQPDIKKVEDKPITKKAVITKITAGDESKEGADITETIMFESVGNDTESVQLSVETSPIDAKLSFGAGAAGTERTYKWNLQEGENTLKITAGEGDASAKTEYTAKITRRAKPKPVDIEILTSISMLAGSQNGVFTDMTTEQTMAILQGKDVVVDLKGPIATIIVACQSNIWKSCKINGKQVTEISMPFIKSAGYVDIELPEHGNTLDVKIEAETDSNTTEANFRIRRLEGTVDMPVQFMGLYMYGSNILSKKIYHKFFDGSNPPYTAGEPQGLELRCYILDIMKSIEIDSKNCEIKTKKGSKGNTIYYTESLITGIKPDGKDIIIKITPKNPKDYHETIWHIRFNYSDLTGNAEFAKDESVPFIFSPLIEHKVTFNDGKPHAQIDDYGAIETEITTYTKASDSTVYYQFVDLDEKTPLTGETQKAMTNSGGKHTSGKITLFTDKPSILRMWVVAKGGATDDDKGNAVFTYNPVKLRWNYDKNGAQDKEGDIVGDNFENEGYGVIKLDRASIKPDNKVYLAFGVYEKDLSGNLCGYTVDTSSPASSFQTSFVELKKLKDEDGEIENDTMLWRMTEVDVSSLTDNTKEVEVILPIQKNGADCFTYKVKVRLE